MFQMFLGCKAEDELCAHYNSSYVFSNTYKENVNSDVFGQMVSQSNIHYYCVLIFFLIYLLAPPYFTGS